MLKGNRFGRYCLAWLSVTIILSILVICFINIQSVQSQKKIIHSQTAHDSYSSSILDITSEGSLIIAVNPDSNSVSLIDTNTLLLISEISVGINPRSVSISSDDLIAYVANQDSDSLSIVNLANETVADEIALGDRPVGVAISPDGNLLAISELGEDQVRLLDSADFKTIAVYPVGDRPYGLAFTPDNRYLLVTHLLSGQVSVIANQPYRIFLPKVFTNFTSALPFPPFTFTEQSQNQEALPEVISTWPNVAPAPSVTINSSGTRGYLPQSMANGLGYNTNFDTSIFPKVSVLNLETWAHQTSEHISLPETDRPVGLPWDAALTQEGQELWIVNAASNDVSVIDIADPEHPGRVANIPVGDNPRGIVFNPDASLAFINNVLAGTVSVIDTSTYTVTGVITATEIPLPPVLLNGKQLFHSSARPELAQAAWISCNSCHVEGEHDGRTWLLQYLGSVPPGEYPIIKRNTTSLLGMIETYPLRWSAEWDESADSEFSIRFEQFGSGLIVGEMHPTLDDPNQGRSYDLDCLAAYIDSLAVPERSYTLTEAEQRGKVVFEAPQTQCANCHPAPLYTDLQVHDVGTADGPGEWFGPLIDTPTLRFLYDSAPYLHDGSAATLYDILTTANPGDEHGVTSHLSPQEISDLIGFLIALPYVEN